ncbi:hypothetical protein ACI2OX_10055 [Bacillus sp. N9]
MQKTKRHYIILLAGKHDQEVKVDGSIYAGQNVKVELEKLLGIWEVEIDE